MSAFMPTSVVVMSTYKHRTNLRLHATSWHSVTLWHYFSFGGEKIRCSEDPWNFGFTAGRQRIRPQILLYHKVSQQASLLQASVSKAPFLLTLNIAIHI